MRWLHRQQDTGAGVALNQKTPAATGSALALDDDNKGGAGHDGLFASGGDAISSASSCWYEVVSCEGGRCRHHLEYCRRWSTELHVDARSFTPTSLRPMWLEADMVSLLMNTDYPLSFEVMCTLWWIVIRFFWLEWDENRMLRRGCVDAKWFVLFFVVATKLQGTVSWVPEGVVWSCAHHWKGIFAIFPSILLNWS